MNVTISYFSIFQTSTHCLSFWNDVFFVLFSVLLHTTPCFLFMNLQIGCVPARCVLMRNTWLSLALVTVHLDEQLYIWGEGCCILTLVYLQVSVGISFMILNNWGGILSYSPNLVLFSPWTRRIHPKSQFQKCVTAKTPLSDRIFLVTMTLIRQPSTILSPLLLPISLLPRSSHVWKNTEKKKIVESYEKDTLDW